MMSIDELKTLHTDTIDEIAPYLLGRGISVEGAKKALLFKCPEDGSQYASRLGIPYLQYSLSGDWHCLMVKYRALGDKEPRYLTDKGSFMGSTAVYAGYKLLYHDRVLCVEGELEAVLLNQMGYPTVALAGTSGASPENLALLSIPSELVLMPDNDEPGAGLAKKIRDAIPGVRVLELPEGCKDFGEFYTGKKEVAEAWLKKRFC